MSQGGETSRPQVPYRVMVVDDSAVVRGLMTRFLEADPALKVVASVSDGRQAVEGVARHSVEVVTLDIEMPVMDGLSALPLIVKARPGVKVIMTSTLTRQNAEVTLRAMREGAHDYMTKPGSGGGLLSAEEFQRELRAKVRSLGAAARADLGQPVASPPRRTSDPRPGEASAASLRSAGAGRGLPPPRMPSGPVTLRPMPQRQPTVIAIGSSTGGPQALFEVLGGLTPALEQPILITQHMPPTFTTILAEHIQRQTGLACREAAEGMPVTARTIYLAPGGFHMLVEPAPGGGARIKLSDGERENYCRPSVDPMLRSMIEIWGGRILMVMLTGMGADGLNGTRAVIQAGGAAIAQDQASSTVWGMPGAVAKAGLCSAVLPLKEIAPWVRKLAMRTAA